jgi:hypothetical protein
MMQLIETIGWPLMFTAYGLMVYGIYCMTKRRIPIGLMWMSGSAVIWLFVDLSLHWG